MISRVAQRFRVVVAMWIFVGFGATDSISCSGTYLVFDLRADGAATA